MSNDIFIRIKTSLERASDTEIDKVKEELKKKLGIVNINTKVDVDSLKEFKNASGETYKVVKNITDELGRQVSITQKMGDETGRVITTNYKKQRLELEKLNAEQSKYWSSRVKETLGSMTTTPDGIKELNAYYKELEATSDRFNSKNINAIDYQIKQRELEGQKFSELLRSKMQQEVQEKKITDELHKQNIAQQKMLETIRGMRGKDGAFIVGENLTKLNQLENTIRGLNPASKDFQKNMRDADLQLKQIATTTGIYKKEVQDASKFTNIFGQSLFEAAKKFAGWLFMGNVVMGVVRSIRFGIQSIIDLDREMVSLRKVTNETELAYREFGNTVNLLAISLGKTQAEVVKSSAEFARLGYNLQQSAILAREALLLSNVGMMDVEQSTRHLISTVKAFGIEIDAQGRNVRRVVDLINETGNKFAINMMWLYIVIYIENPMNLEI